MLTVLHIASSGESIQSLVGDIDISQDSSIGFVRFLRRVYSLQLDLIRKPGTMHGADMGQRSKRYARCTGLEIYAELAAESAGPRFMDKLEYAV